MVRTILMMLAAGMILLLSPAIANADHDDLVYPDADWQVRQIGPGDAGWSPAEMSTVVNATELMLVKPDGSTGTSAETANLNVDGDTITVDVELSGGAVPDAGAIRLFAYDTADADTLGAAPTAMVVYDGSGEMTLNVSSFTAPIGTVGLVYDASNDSAGSVTFSNLAVDGDVGSSLISFFAHVEPEPEVCEFDSSLLADDPECVEPEDEGTPDPEPSETSSPESTGTPAAASDTDTLPDTGAGAWALVIIGAGMVMIGGGVMLGRRLS